MIWWKEWRETRFGFLTALIFVSGLYFSLPERRQESDSYWLGIFVMFFGTATALALGSSAISSEIGADTMPFLLSKPARKSRLLTAKYVVRAVESMLVFVVPVLCLIDWNDLKGWMWVPPYFMQKYILIGALSILLVFSSSFFFSILFKKPTHSALAAIAFLVAYFTSIGGTVLSKTYNMERVDPYVYILLLISVGIFAASQVLFRVREF